MIHLRKVYRSIEVEYYLFHHQEEKKTYKNNLTRYVM